MPSVNIYFSVNNNLMKNYLQEQLEVHMNNTGNIKNTTMKIQERSAIGHGKAKRLLEQGIVPAVVYGGGSGSAAAQVDKSELKRFLKTNGKSALFTTEFAQEQDLTVIIKDIQYDPVNKDIIHLDFQRVDPQDKVQVQIPVKVTGGDLGIKAGNSVLHQLNTVTVECPAGSIPQYANADIASMKPGQSFTAADFKFPSDVRLVTDPKKVILTIKGHKSEAIPEE